MNPALPKVVIVCVVLSTSGINAAENDNPLWQTFLKRHCLKCHGDEKQEADLRLDALSDLSTDERRTRWQYIRQKIADREMPPEDSPQPQATERYQLLAWISETYDDATSAQHHWSFQPIARPEIPAATGEQANAIDAFILWKLEEQHLTASPRAERRTLLRRITLDLIGLPPTPEEVQAFLGDRSEFDVAFGRVVDRLLHSPRYGERWAQHWLDVIR